MRILCRLAALLGWALAAFGQAGSVKVTVLSTMLSGSYTGEWGFSALVEVDGRKFLFDTGARPETVLNNAREMKIDLSEVEQVILTHNHTDHTGGLVTLRRDVMRRNQKGLATAHAGAGILLARQPASSIVLAKGEYAATGAKFVEHDKAFALAPGVWLTGPIPRTHNERNWSGSTKIRTAEGESEDTLPEDQAMVIRTAKGLVVISGCGHAGIVNTLEYARKIAGGEKIYAALGGFHLFSATPETLRWTAEKLRGMQLECFLGAHCTGMESTFALRGMLGLPAEKMTVGFVGQKWDLAGGFSGGRP
jgi:7,8-dihydropterin-6-yl-methyl-4-(beta-D-ribofuranosyl)aminobenzene 5'-phosphate synthase